MNFLGPSNFLPFVILLTLITSVSAADNSELRPNPFELPSGIYSQDNAPQEKPQNLQLQAIFDIKGKKIATISGENFITGDFAFGKKVIEISNNQVTLHADGKEEVLILDKSRFQLRKNNKK
ncbi:MAG: hypothetical protein H8E42_13795 [Nitrospinae bacterium]|nr:hypothetical protein [Nitrospinota bacterium]MBL7021225.1 hypothetical protein [Nitrospinaceae bacterium]